MQNNVADWLPGQFDETQDLKEFRKYFVGDQFVVISGPWCYKGNQVFTNLRRKIYEESLEYESVLKETKQEEVLRAHRKGDELGLMYTGNYYEDWGEQNERWLSGKRGQWYFINRQGELYRWEGQNNVIQGIQRFAERSMKGRNEANGTYIDTFGPPPDDENGVENPFYSDPQKLCARPFKTVTSGVEVFEKMAGPDGTRRVGLFDEDDEISFRTKIETHQLLTGTLFGPTPSPTFGWTFDTLLKSVDGVRHEQLKSPIYRERFHKFIEDEVQRNYGGDFSGLTRASQDKKLELWYRLWDVLEIEPPPRQTCLIVTLNEPILSEMSRAVGRPLLGKPRGRILEIATGECGIDPENLHIGGPPSDNVAIDEEGTITLLRLVNLSLLIGVGLAYACFRSIRVTIMLFFVGGVSAIASLAYVWFAGSSPDAILMTMPSLIYVLGLSGAVHVVNYYREACIEGGTSGAVEKAIKFAWFPCTLCAFTTALGLASLCTSNLAPINKFGFFSAIATIGTLALIFTYLPAALTVWPPGYKRRKGDVPHEETSHLALFVSNMWNRIGEFVMRHNIAVVTATVLLMAVGAYGVTKVRTSVQLLKLFDPKAKILEDYRWMETNLGKLVPMELVVGIDKDMQQEQWYEQQRSEALTKYQKEHPDETESKKEEFKFEYDKLAYDLKYSMLERIELSRRVRTQVEKFFGPDGVDYVGTGMSTDVFVPLEEIGPIATGNSIEDKLKITRSVFDAQLQRKRNEMLEEDYYAVIGKSNIDAETARVDKSDPDRAGRELWRISIRLAALNDVDYGQFVNELKAVVEPIMMAYEARTQILKALQKQLGEKSLTDGKILILGRNPDRMAETLVPNYQDPSRDVMKLVDQTFIFSDTLQDLLENRGFTMGVKKPPFKNKKYHWVDPTTFTDDRPYPDAASWVDFIKNFECVVMIENNELFDEALFRTNAAEFIDCRNHVFEINPKTNQPVAGFKTAMQRKKGGEPVAVTTIYTGIIPIVYKAQNQLLRSLVVSIAMSFCMIAVVMMVLLRNWRDPIRLGNVFNAPGGSLSMLPNIFPIVVVFGFMGLRGLKVDIGSMMTASVAMGIAVDDTIHFLNWFRKGLARGLPRREAIRLAYRRCAVAMTETTLIAGFGLSAFALSTFVPTQRFGVLMLFLLAVALVGDLIFLPAILSGPLGKFFGKELPQSATDQQTTERSIRVISDEDDADSDEDFPDIHPDSLKHLNPPDDSSETRFG